MSLLGRGKRSALLLDGCDLISSPLSGGKYWLTTLFDDGNSLSRGGMYCWPTNGFFGGAGGAGRGVTTGRGVLGAVRITSTRQHTCGC